MFPRHDPIITWGDAIIASSHCHHSLTTVTAPLTGLSTGLVALWELLSRLACIFSQTGGQETSSYVGVSGGRST